MKLTRLLTWFLLLVASDLSIKVRANAALDPASPIASTTAIAIDDQAPAASLDFASIEAVIEHAYLSGESELLAPAIKSLEARLRVNSSDPAALYFRGFASFAEAGSARAKKDQPLFIKELETAIELLARVKGAPWETEAEGLQSYLLGQLIGAKGAASAMSLGPQSSHLIEKAAASAPNSPRIMLFRGISLLNTPEMWGGDPSKGKQLIKKAAESFGKTTGPANLHWGGAEAWAWMGIAAHQEHKVDIARNAWQKALELEPNYLWVKYVLLPSLDGATQKSSP